MTEMTAKSSKLRSGEQTRADFQGKMEGSVRGYFHMPVDTTLSHHSPEEQPRPAQGLVRRHAPAVPVPGGVHWKPKRRMKDLYTGTRWCDGKRDLYLDIDERAAFWTGERMRGMVPPILPRLPGAPAPVVPARAL